MPADEIIRPAIVEIVNDSEAIATVAKGFHQDQVVTQEQAYRVYCSTGARSLRKTADILGIPHGTVLSWNRRYHWQKKLRDIDLEVTEGLAQATAVLAVSRGIKALEVLSQIMEDGEVDPRARVSAASEVLKVAAASDDTTSPSAACVSVASSACADSADCWRAPAVPAP